MSPAEYSSLTPAGVRRLVALHAVGRRLAFRPTIVNPEIAGRLAIADVEQRFAGYLLDPCGQPLTARTPAEDSWFESSLLLRTVAPGSALAIGDDIAAIVAAPRLLDGDQLSEQTFAARCANRADDAIAAAVALLSPAFSSGSLAVSKSGRS